MMDNNIDELDFTGVALDSLYDTVDNESFHDMDSQLIYDSLTQRLRVIPFGDYLKRYIYQKAELSGDFKEIPLEDYQSIIQDSFQDNHVPASFTPTTSKLRALSKNWLTQQAVKRSVVFLLGFGLNMSLDDVSNFLVKCLREQDINPKDPFEVVCWYCYKNGYGYLKFEQLWELYENAPASEESARISSNEQTINVRQTMFGIKDDDTLVCYLSRLKTSDSVSRISVTANIEFGKLYDQARELIAKMYNEERSIDLIRYQEELKSNDRLYDYQRAQRIVQYKQENKKFEKEDIAESDLEHVLCSAIPTDKHGNLTPSKASDLHQLFSGKRFSRQRIGEIRAGKADVTRFDLITLCFFVISQKVDEYPDAKQRYLHFVKITNEILQKCSLAPLLVSNPYECFVQMCILSEEPLSTYADVWELSYE